MKSRAHHRSLVLALVLAPWVASGCGGGGGDGSADVPFGLQGHVPVAGLNVAAGSAAPALLAAPAAFPALGVRALHVTHAGDASGRLYAIEQEGRVVVFDDDPLVGASSVFLDVTDRVAQTGGEEGLLGLAFHPSYATNGWVYVSYVAESPRRTVLSRFTAPAPGLATPVDAATEEVLLSFERPAAFHLGGCIAFAPDGTLLLSSGDGVDGAAAQDLGSLLGKLIRVDEDGGIPLDNPFVGVPGAREEVFALGFRNPWRFAFDPLDGTLWLADAGADESEEVDVVVAGGNYGWPVFEGDQEHDNPGGLLPSDFDQPVHVYSSHGGGTIIGGRVYRGAAHPDLYGRYVYADWSGAVRALTWDGTSVVADELVAAGVPFPVSFGEDANGELLIACIGDERVHRLAPHATAPTEAAMPALLSETGIFASLVPLTPVPGVIEYDVNAPLWSDGATKRRFLALPGTAQIGFASEGAWDLPVGTVLVKHFEVLLADATTRRLETRLLVHDAEGWQGYTYRWNVAQDDADLLDGSAFEYLLVDDGLGGSDWRSFYYPSRTDCLTCHNENAGFVLGLRTAQMNRDFDYPPMTDNQLRAFDLAGLFDVSIGAAGSYDALADPYDAALGLSARARAYLDVNCSQCHRPGGATAVDMDLRAETDRLDMNAIGVAPTSGDLGIGGAERIAAGSHGQSVSWVRAGQTNGLRMPALASNEPDVEGLALLQQWIDAGAP